MADPTRKKNKGHDTNPSARVIKLNPGESLHIVTDHDVPYEFRLQQFADGMQKSVRNGKKIKFIPFSGRPELTYELATAIRISHVHSAPATCEAVEMSLRWWWRFLDRFNENFPVRSVADLDDIHYAFYANLGDEMPSPGIASVFFKLVNVARGVLNRTRLPSQSLSDLLWTAKEKPMPDRPVVPISDVKHLYHYVKHICFDAIRRYETDPLADPTLNEINALFVIFALQSGWNSSVIESIDIESENFIRPHPTNPNFSYVVSPKARANDEEQFALSRNKSLISPANIVTALIKATKRMRNKLKIYQNELLVEFSHLKKEHGDPKDLDKLRIKIAKVRKSLKSVWIYTQKTNTPAYAGTIAEAIGVIDGMRLIGNNGRPVLHTYAEEINARLRASETPVTADISMRDLRDAFISWRWITSHSWLDAMLAAGHTSRQSLVRYLKRKQIQERSRRDFVKLGDAMWTTIKTKSPLGAIGLPLAICAKLENINDEQIDRWLAGKDKTYCGTGCMDFKNPPKTISPHHIDGMGCRIQRCTLCSNAILLPDSDKFLARRLAELRYHRTQISEHAWQQSNYPDELENTEAALKYFDQAQVNRLVSKWETAIISGQHIPVTMEGAYV